MKATGAWSGVPVDEVDVVVVHHRLAVTRVGAEADWLEAKPTRYTPLFRVS